MNSLTIKSTLQLFEEIVGDKAPEIFSSEGSALNKYSHQLSIKLVDVLKPLFMKLAAEARDSAEGAILNKILISASVIEQKTFKAHNVFNKVVARLKESKIDFVTDEEISEAKTKLLGPDTSAREFALEEEVLYNEMKQIYCTNAAIKSGLFTKGATFNTVR